MEISGRGLLQGAIATSVLAVGDRVAATGPARVFVVKGTDRARAVAACFDAAQFTACDERAVAIKANFNSGDAFPASTRPATLRALFGTLKSRRATQLTLAERSGMGDTRNVLTSTGAVDVVKDAGAQLVVLAEANLAWRPALSVMDCLEAFVDGGPEAGRRAAPGVFLASEDRCALDAAAIALLRLHGMTGPAARGPIGETAQLARAIALGVGQPPASVAVVPVEPSARDVAQRIGELLARG